ncbi:MAG: hypothetical protein ABS98_09770 [Lysobacteraceae bacterium SCN 69-48]|nr:MAG: hypothetical protein ABS98_09770 [Xanthomonadaceae bacterium SCN 69-48]
MSQREQFVCFGRIANLRLRDERPATVLRSQLQRHCATRKRAIACKARNGRGNAADHKAVLRTGQS